MEAATQQYTLVKEAREVVFNFCESLAPKDYIKKMNDFGQNSIRNTQAHIIDAYIHWIGNFALEQSLPYLNARTIGNVDTMRGEYLRVNKLIESFFEKFYHKEDKVITRTIDKKGEISTTPLALFTHVITHEFHHKGQLVTMSRMLGYQPPDTDIIRL